METNKREQGGSGHYGWGRVWGGGMESHKIVFLTPIRAWWLWGALAFGYGVFFGFVIAKWQ